MIKCKGSVELNQSQILVEPVEVEINAAMQGPPGVGVPNGGSTGQVLTKASNADFATSWTTATKSYQTATFAVALGTPATTGTNKSNVLIVPANATVVKCWIYAKTAPTGSSLICDILDNGTSIWAATPANRITLPSGQNTASQTAFDTTTLVAGDILTCDIDQVGSTIAGQDITIQLVCQIV